MGHLSFYSSVDSSVSIHSWDWGFEDETTPAVAPTRKEGAKKRTTKIDVPEYDDPLHVKLAQLMRLRMQAILFGKNGQDRTEYLRWFFGATPDQHGLTFDLVAQALGGDPDLVRAELQVQLARRWIVLLAPIEGAIDPSEDFVESSARIAGQIGVQAFRLAWKWPGITPQQLLARLIETGFQQEAAHRAVQRLLNESVIVATAGHCYAVGYRGKKLAADDPFA